MGHVSPARAVLATLVGVQCAAVNFASEYRIVWEGKRTWEDAVLFLGSALILLAIGALVGPDRAAVRTPPHNPAPPTTGS
jgi:hypothetical protein